MRGVCIYAHILSDIRMVPCVYVCMCLWLLCLPSSGYGLQEVHIRQWCVELRVSTVRDVESGWPAPSWGEAGTGQSALHWVHGVVDVVDSLWAKGALQFSRPVLTLFTFTCSKGIDLDFCDSYWQRMKIQRQGHSRLFFALWIWIVIQKWPTV